MWSVEGAVDDHAAVEVDDGPVFVAFPLQHSAAVGPVVFGDGRVVNCVEEVRINSNTLVCGGRSEVAQGGAAKLGLGAGCAVEEGTVAGG